MQSHALCRLLQQGDSIQRAGCNDDDKFTPNLAETEYLDIATQSPGQFARDAEPESGTAKTAGGGHIGLYEWLK